MKLTVCCLVIAIILVSCKNERDPLDRINRKIRGNSAGAFQRYLPQQYNDSDYYWQIVREMRSTTKLPSIENGSKDFQIRIWEDVDRRRYHMLFLLMHDSSTWTTRGCVYKVKFLGEHRYALVGDLISLGDPKSGWNHFLNEIIDKGIMDLKDESDIPGYRDATDQSIVAVEIADKNYYRYYELPGAYDINASVKDAKAMVEILALIKKEFPQLQDTGE